MGSIQRRLQNAAEEKEKQEKADRRNREAYLRNKASQDGLALVRAETKQKEDKERAANRERNRFSSNDDLVTRNRKAFNGGTW